MCTAKGAGEPQRPGTVVRPVRLELSPAQRCRAWRTDAQGASAHHPVSGACARPVSLPTPGLSRRETAPPLRLADYARRCYGATGGAGDALRRIAHRGPERLPPSSALLLAMADDQAIRITPG